MTCEKSSYTFGKNQIHHTPFPTFALSLDGQIIIWSESCESHFGYSMGDFSSSDHLFIKNTLLPTLSDDSWQHILSSNHSLRFENIQLLTKDDQFIDTSLITLPTTIDNTPCIVFICITHQQVSLYNNPNQELSDLKNGLLSSFMIVNVDSEGFITYCNEPFLKISHWTPKRVLGKTFWQLFPDKDQNISIANKIWKTISSGEIWQGEVEKTTKDGASYWVYLTAIPTYNASEKAYHFLLVEHDITNSKALQQRLEKLAYIDTETGLMNVHRLEKVVTEMIEEGRHFSFVYLSMDKYYTLKDLHASQAENSLIIDFTKRMKIYFQDSLMARINEHDFVVITPLGEWFIQGFLIYLKQNPVYSGNTAVPIFISGGITRSPQDQSNFSQLMKASLATISNVREAGGDQIVSLSNATHKALSRKSLIEKRLLLALDQKNLKVLYQPQVHLKTNQIVTVEALVRWEDEEIGVISPDELIPIAEETGLINNIGSFVIEKACMQAAKWHQNGYNLKVSINLSAREFRDKNMAKFIIDTLAKTGCPGRLIQIEITEKFALEAEAETSIIKQMKQLEKEGIVFVLDDFGTGYASFRYMQLLPIEMLKIDQMFISSLLKSEKTQRLIKGLVHFGNSMNITVLAEGVETEEQKQLLQEYGCDGIQGYLVSKPVTEDEILRLLEL